MRKIWLRSVFASLGIAVGLADPSLGFPQTAPVRTVRDRQTSEEESIVLIPVRQADSDKFGYIDAQGKVVIGFQFDMADDFHDSLAQVRTDGKCGYIDIQGKLAIPYRRCHLFGEFHEGFAVVSFSGRGREFFMDKKGNLLKAPSFSSAQPFSEGRAAVITKYKGEWRWGYIGADGKFAIPPRFEPYPGNFSEGVAYVRLGGKVGFIDRQGVFVIPPRFDEGRDFSEGLAAVRVGDKWGFINHSGEIVIQPQFDWVLWFSEGLAPAYAKKGTYLNENSAGYIDRQGRWVIEPRYQDVQPFRSGRGEVERGGYFGLVDSRGKEVVAAQYLDCFSVGDGLWYGRTVNPSHTAPESRIIDKQGNIIYHYDTRNPRCMSRRPPFPDPDQVAVMLEPMQATLPVGGSMPFRISTHGFTEGFFFSWQAQDKDGRTCYPPAHTRLSFESCSMGYLAERREKHHGVNEEKTGIYYAPKIPGTYFIYAEAWQSENCDGVRRVEKQVKATITVVP